MRADYPAGYPISSHNEESRNHFARKVSLSLSLSSFLLVACSFIRLRRVTSTQSSFSGANNIWRTNVPDSFRSGKARATCAALQIPCADAIGRGDFNRAFCSVYSPIWMPEIVPRSRSPSRYSRIGNIWVDLQAKHAFNRRFGG